MGELIDLQIHTAGPPQPLPSCPFVFPDVRKSKSDGFAAFGGDFEPSTVVAAYRAGLFPWPRPGEELLWFSPDPRAVLPVDNLHVSRRLERTARAGRFRVTLDAAFERVIRACAERKEGTWITPRIIDGYTRLHELGWAHSFEAWTADGTLAGGLYGLGIGALFGAESMFFRASDASKVAMVAMVEHARRIGLQVIDVQVLTPHTVRMGAVEIPRESYLERLAAALRVEIDWRHA
jgi:leucyl/phenylalanyl-tRNA---protein transferase